MMTLNQFRSKLYALARIAGRNAQKACQGYSQAHRPPYRREDHGLYISTDQIGD